MEERLGETDLQAGEKKNVSAIGGWQREKELGWEAGGEERWWNGAQNDNKSFKNIFSQGTGWYKFIFGWKKYIFLVHFLEMVVV